MIQSEVLKEIKMNLFDPDGCCANDRAGAHTDITGCLIRVEVCKCTATSRSRFPNGEDINQMVGFLIWLVVFLTSEGPQKEFVMVQFCSWCSGSALFQTQREIRRCSDSNLEL